MSKSLVARVVALEQQVASLMGGRPGRKALPIVVTEEGVCGIDPDSDSTVCPHASLYRHQKGCEGSACVLKSSTYYKDYKAARKGKK